ncbi:inositol monophosphatase family protein [Acidobacteriota bacterium]
MNFGKYLKVAKEAAFQAGKMLKQNSCTPQEIHYKGAVDLVTDFDKRSQDVIFKHLFGHFPEHDFLAEENLSEKKGSPFCWIIDPIDGTTNYAHNFPVFCISIALTFKNETKLGVIYDPMRDEMFTAVKGQGAALNNSPIKVSSVRDLDKSLLATGFPYDLRESCVNNFDHFFNFATCVQGIRRGGSAAIDLCYVACGRFDGFWELKLQPWDVAAGRVIVLEAGGHVSDFQNSETGLSAQETLATNGLIHDQMVRILKMSLFPS